MAAVVPFYLLILVVGLGSMCAEANAQSLGGANQNDGGYPASLDLGLEFRRIDVEVDYRPGAGSIGKFEDNAFAPSLAVRSREFLLGPDFWLLALATYADFSTDQQRTAPNGHYQSLGTEVHGTYAYVVPAIAIHPPQQKNGFRVTGGLGVTYFKIAGEAYVAPGGAIPVANGVPTPQTQRVPIKQESAAAIVVIQVDYVVDRIAIRFSEGGPYSAGTRQDISVQDARFGVVIGF